MRRQPLHRRREAMIEVVHQRLRAGERRPQLGDGSPSCLSFTSAFTPARVWLRFVPIDSNGMLFSRLTRLVAAVATSSELPPRTGMT